MVVSFTVLDTMNSNSAGHSEFFTASERRQRQSCSVRPGPFPKIQGL